jgi:hypothetical protein
MILRHNAEALKTIDGSKTDRKAVLLYTRD